MQGFLAQMLASWSLGHGAMPQWLGLSRRRFQDLISSQFPDVDPTQFDRYGSPLDSERWDEMADLRNLLLQNMTRSSEADAVIVDLLVAGCMGSDHLWQDLGLWQRSELTRIMHDYFLPLAKRNDRDMKWKKFLYKQLCEKEEIRTCRAPTCASCIDYAGCFGPED